jgi:hypothetical protein
LKLTERVARKVGTMSNDGIVEGQITEVLTSGLVSVVTDSGQRLEGRCPQHVSVSWLKAALSAGAIECVLLVRAASPALVWAVFSTPAHDEAAAARQETVLTGRRITVRATEAIDLTCGPSLVTLRGNGEVRTRGKDVLSRATRLNRLKGGSVRIN